MKKTRVFLVMLLALFLCSCTAPREPAGTTAPAPDTTEATAQETYPDIIDEVTVQGVVDAESSTPWQIRTRKYRNDEPGYIGCDLYIEVDTGRQVLKKLLSPSIIPCPGGCKIYLADLDGDGGREILVHHNTGGCGGFGSWQAWVLKVERGELRILFENANEFDTGFESRFLEGHRLEVKNNITGYTLVYDVTDRYGQYLDACQELPDYPFMLDSFFIFEPTDPDNDGVSEILCKQYTSIRDHADHTGTACTILKLTPEQTFEVIEAWYEPNTDS